MHGGPGSEQRAGEERRPAARTAGQRSIPQQRHAQHEDQGHDPGRRQPAEAVSQRPQRRVDHRRPREVRQERHRRPCSQPGPLQMPGPQVGGLVLERGVRPQQPDRQRVCTTSTASNGSHTVRPGPGPVRPAPGLSWAARAQPRCAARPCCSARAEPDGENRSQPAGLSSIRAPASEHGPRVVPPRQPARTHPTYCHVRASVCDLPPEQKYRIGTVLSGSSPMWRVY